MIRQAQVRWKTMKEHSGWYSLLSWPWTPVFGRLTPWIFTKPCSTTLLLSASFAIRKYPQGEIASNASFISLDTPLYPGLGHVGFLMPQFSSVAQLCPTRCDPMNRSMPGLHVYHQFREFTQTHFHRVGGTIQPSHPLSSPFPPPSIFPSIRVFSSESVHWIRWPKYWNFSCSISPFNEYSELISFRIDWFDLLAVQGTPKSLLQHYSSKALILQCSAFFMVHSHIRLPWWLRW